MRTKTVIFIIVLLPAVVVGILLFHRAKAGGDTISNVVLISIDTCRADYLSCYGFSLEITPNIDAIAAEAVLFEHVLTPAPLTLPAHSSMLTGTIPPYHGVHDNIGYRLGGLNTTLAEVLKSNGFTTGAIISSFVLDSQFGLNQGFDTYDDSFDEELNTIGIVERRGSEASDHAVSWIEHHKDESFFLFLHYYDPHQTYEPPEPFKSLYTGNPYAGEIAYTDYCIGRVIDKLKELDLYDSSLIIITSDHGEALGQHGEVTHGYFIYQGVLKVPLIFKLPGKSGPERITEPVGLIDIFPTVCQLLDIEIPSEIQGADLSGYFSKKKYTPKQRTFYSESFCPTKFDCNPLLGVIADDWKYIQTTRAELYDLSKDPAEWNNVIENYPQRARILQDKLIRILDEQLRENTDSDLDLSAQDIQRLDSLGYVSRDMNEDFEFDQEKNDAKDLLQLYKVDAKVRAYLCTKNMVSAKEACKELLDMYPDFDMVYRYLGAIATEEGDNEKALSYYNKFLELTPDKYKGYTYIAMTLSLIGRFDESIENFNKALELKPDIADVYYHLGVAYANIGNLDDAVKNWEKALLLKQDDDARIYIALADALVYSGNLDRAIECWQESLKLDSGDAKTHRDLADALFRVGNVERAIYHYSESIEINPGQPVVEQKLAELHFMEGQTGKAIEHWERGLQLQPNWPGVLNNLAWIMATSQQKEFRSPTKALKYAEKACELTNFKEVEYLDTLSVAYGASGKFNEAIETAEKALRLYQNAGQSQKCEEVKKRIELFVKEQPYREKQ